MIGTLFSLHKLQQANAIALMAVAVPRLATVFFTARLALTLFTEVIPTDPASVDLASVAALRHLIFETQPWAVALVQTALDGRHDKC